MKHLGSGWGSGLLGVIIFSGSLPATRVAVGGFSPVFLTSARAVVAGCLAGLALAVFSRHRPTGAEFSRLAIVAGGVVLGFPLLTALALRQMTSAHSIVFIGLLPLATALFGVLRGGERPCIAFWMFSILGALSVAGFALLQPGEATGAGDGLMLAAILFCGLGYAEGALLSRRLGGWQVISWALVVALPAMALMSFATMPDSFAGVSTAAWAGLGYISVFSMWIGFVFWYRGLALGGIAGVGQLQLLQPFFGLALAGLLLGEPIAWSMIASTILVVACVAGARRYA